MYDIEPKSEDERWERKIDSELKRIQSEAALPPQEPAPEEESPPTTWAEATDRAAARLKADAQARR